LELLLLAAKLNKPTNSAYLARNSRNCLVEFDEGLNFDIQNEGLYIYSDAVVIRRISKLPNFRELCRKFKFGIVCTRKWSVLLPLFESNEFIEAAVDPIPEYHFGDMLDFSVNSGGCKFLDSGWSISESWGTWTLGSESEISLKIVNLPKDQLLMRVNARAYVHAKKPEKTIDVYINGEKIAVWKYIIGEDVVMRTVSIPRKYILKDWIIRVKFVSQSTESPFQAGYSEDKRQLSLGLVNLSIFPYSGMKIENELIAN
jgi:hypothetical protein